MTVSALVGHAATQCGPSGSKAHRSHLTAQVYWPGAHVSRLLRDLGYEGVGSHMPATPAIDVPSGWMAPKGHAMAHSLHPMHSCSLTWMRSPSCSMAFTGQTSAQGAPSQWWQAGGRNTAGLHERQARRILKTLHPVGVGTGGLACSAADAPLRVDVDEAVHPHFLSK